MKFVTKGVYISTRVRNFQINTLINIAPNLNIGAEVISC